MFELTRGEPTCARSVSRRLSLSATEQVRSGKLGVKPGQRLRRGQAQLRPWQTLMAQHPELIGEIDATRNRGLAPDEVAAGSKQQVFWRCSVCGYRWQATIGSRSAGHGCPECYNTRRRAAGPMAPDSKGSLAEVHPDLALEWDLTRNAPVAPEAIRPGSRYKAWWHCGACSHRWQATVKNRANGHGCPRCAISRRARVRSEVPLKRSLAARFPELADQLRASQEEELNPESLGASSSKRVWWHCPVCSHDWRAQVSSRTTRGAGCPACRERRRRRLN